MMEPSEGLPAGIDEDRCRPAGVVDGSWKAPQPPAFRFARVRPIGPKDRRPPSWKDVRAFARVRYQCGALATAFLVSRKASSSAC